jgi:hypothetical protein
MSSTDREVDFLDAWSNRRAAAVAAEECHHRSDAQNVVLEADAEENEARVLSCGHRDRRPVARPTLRDLLTVDELMIEMTEAILDERLVSSAERDFLAKLSGQLAEIRHEIRAQISGVQPVVEDADPEKAPRRR